MPARLLQIKQQEEREIKIAEGKVLETPAPLFKPKKFLAHRIQEALSEEREEKNWCVIL